MYPFVVGVTGHRPNRLAIGEGATRRRVQAILARIGRCTGRRPLVAHSALAEGADRSFGHVALRLGWRLHVSLPFSSADYESTFADMSQLTVYRALLDRASRVRVLAGSRTATKVAYEAQGHHMVNDSDLVVAVWDGKPAAGRGGTPEIVGHALARGVPVLWIDAARNRATRAVLAPPGRPAAPLAIATPGRHGSPVTASLLAGLVRAASRRRCGRRGACGRVAQGR